jgi:uncharacterized membrane protein YsdA (DUF1294 family)
MIEREQRRPAQRKKLSASAIVLLIGLLIYPTLAAFRLSRWVDGRIIAGYFAAVSLITYSVYWRDKRHAEAGQWRTPESALHIAEIMGGWPAAYLAQRALRHKIKKTAYQIKFWSIVLLHEAVAFDFLLDWHYARAVISLLRAK